MRRLSIVLIGFATLALAPTARAEEIDGQWCHNDGRRMTINGSDLVAPNGARIRGNNGGRTFQHAPQGRGSRPVNMTMQGDRMNLTQCYMPPETWQRCNQNIS